MSAPFDPNDPVKVDIVKVHLVKDDTRPSGLPDISANHYSVAATSVPAQLLPHSPNRTSAVLTVCGVAGDTALICRQGDGQAVNAAGTTIQPGQVIPIRATSEMWLIAKSGASVVVGVVAEYREHG